MATQHDGNGPPTERLHSVRRAFAVLEALAVRPDGASPKELSRTLGLHLSTTYRLLNTLVAGGYVAREPDGPFRLGSRVAYLHHGYLASLRPPPEALPFVHALQIATSETTILSQLEGDDVVTTVVVPGSHAGAVPPGYIGLAVPAHAIAAGRVLLAGLPAPQLEAFLDRRAAVPEAPFPLTNPGALRADLERIRDAGYAVDRGGWHYDVCCVAAPVVDRGGAVEAAISTVAPRARFRQEEPALVKTILAVTRAIDSMTTAAPAREAGCGQQGEEAAAQAAIEAVVTEVAAAMSRVG